MWPFTSGATNTSDSPTLQKASNSANDKDTESLNIWYPLAGPPKNEEERERLKEAIDKEHDTVMKEFGDSKTKRREVEEEIERVAKMNCADLILDWRVCLKSISSDRFFTMCEKSHKAVQNCVSLQSDNLYRLGYHKEFLSGGGKDEKKLDNLADRADEMYLRQVVEQNQMSHKEE